MKYFFQIVFFVLVSLVGFAQNFSDVKKDTLPKEKIRRWAVGISAGHIYAFNTYNFSSANYDFEKKVKWGYGSGIAFSYKVLHFFDLSSGISYNKLGYKYLVTFPPVPKFSRVDNYDYSLLSISLEPKWSFGHNKIKYQLGTGIELSYLENNSCNCGGIDQVLFKNGSMIYLVLLNMKILYALNKSIAVFIEPKYHHAITPLIHDSKYYPGEFTMNYLKFINTNFGFSYNFKK
ncbi:MAG: hypothetical protein HY840_08715 [Bacteroidetes bacterium]|nr:hypothetical protein [Bacteroidota bacterium]